MAYHEARIIAIVLGVVVTVVLVAGSIGAAVT